jgi:hypothetical protein
MKKLILTAMLALFVSSQANAGFIQGVTGEDMAGIVVTVTYEDGSTSTSSFIAGVAGEGSALSIDGWSLSLIGDSFGEYDDVTDTLYGVWTLTNLGFSTIVSLFVDLSPVDFVFDTEYGNESANGSGSGRELVSTDDSAEVTYGSLYMDELYSTLTISGLSVATGETFSFMTDTDKVPAPAGLAFIALVLAGLGARARKLAA